MLPRRCKETKVAGNDLLHFLSVIVGLIANILLAIFQPVTSIVGVRRVHGTVQQGGFESRQKVYPGFC